MAPFKAPKDTATHPRTGNMSTFIINPSRFAEAESDLEADLTLTQSFSVGELSAGDFERSQNCVFACELSIPESPVGLIFELGGGAVGACVAFRSDHSFVIRSSNGAVNAPTTSDNSNAVLYIATGNNEPSGDGSLVWEFNPSLGRIRAWWNGSSIGESTASNGRFRSDLFAGSDAGGYDFDQQGGSGCVGEPTTGLGASTSDLRYYQNQLVS